MADGSTTFCLGDLLVATPTRAIPCLGHAVILARVAPRSYARGAVMPIDLSPILATHAALLDRDSL